jgi:hypothetical protein
MYLAKVGRAFAHRWSGAPGDPKDRYVVRVIIEGTLERVF